MKKKFVSFKVDIKKVLILVIIALALASSQALASDVDKEPYSQSWGMYQMPEGFTLPDGTTARFMAVFSIIPDEGWYTYSHDPQSELGQPTVLTVRTAPDAPALRTYYPPGRPKPDPIVKGAFMNVYDGPTRLFTPLPELDGGDLMLGANLSMLLCTKTRCLPVKQDYTFIWDMAGQSPPPADQEPFWPVFLASLEHQAPADPGEVSDLGGQDASATPALGADIVLDDEAAGGIADMDFTPRYFTPALEVGGIVPALLFGLLAGFLLNFMPCVLPVVALKMSTLLTPDQQGRRIPREKIFREHNLFFAFGVLAYFFTLSIVLGLTGAAWGQIFQKPEVVMGLTALVFGLGLSLAGLYHLPVVDLKRSSETSTNPKIQALFTGFLATLLATPCSGPFLGGVLGWALLQPPMVISAVFFSIGVGMAAPYLVMVASPGLVRFFPKPGPWVAYLEKAVAFFLMGTCIYLISILPANMVVSCLALLWLTGLWAWVWGMAGPGCSPANRCLIKLVALAVLAGGAWFAMQPPAPEAHFKPFNAQVFKEQLGEKTLFLEFTADWCPTCKVLESTVLTDDNLSRWKEKYDLTLVKVDLTKPFPEAEELLKKLGSQSIPVAAIFPAGDMSGSPLVLRDIYTGSQLEAAFKKASSR